MEAYYLLNDIVGFRITDDPLTIKPPTAPKFIWANHKFNVASTLEQYVPYFTASKKIQE